MTNLTNFCRVANSPKDIQKSSRKEVGNKLKKETIKWWKLTSNQYSNLPRWGHSCAFHSGKMYVFGGRRTEDRNDIYSFDVKTQQWNEVILKRLTFNSPVPRRRHSAVFLGNQMIIFGGFDGSFYNDMQYATFSDLVEDDYLENVYIKDTLNWINNSFQSDIYFIFHSDTHSPITIYCHSNMLVFKLMMIKEGLDWETPQLIKFIIENSKEISDKTPLKFTLPENLNAKYMQTLSKCYDCIKC